MLRVERKGLESPAELDPALAALCEGGILRAVPEEARPKGGRPSRQYAVHPGLHQARRAS